MFEDRNDSFQSSCFVNAKPTNVVGDFKDAMPEKKCMGE